MHKHGHHYKSRDQPGKFKRYVLLALVFLAFFAMSNYFMGSVADTPIPSSQTEIDRSIVNDQQPGQPGIKTPAKPVVDNKGRTGTVNRPNKSNGDLPSPPKNPEIKDHIVDPVVEEPEEKDPPATCKHTRSRDYNTDPVAIAGRFSGKAECDVPCVGDGSTPDAFVGFRGGSCGHTKSIFFTMENTAPPAGSYDIVANTQLNSDVPLPYFNWVEYDFMTPVNPKTAKAHVAAFISNCGPQRRLHWMEQMIKAGVKIDSYGACMRNKQVPGEYQSKFGGNYNAMKMAIVSTYKFTMSFENSATDDYVTEKLFGVLAAGSVPLYDGAPNGKKFGPSAKSMLFAGDFGTPEKMAEYILYLDKNDTAYNEYLSWKKNGPTDDWVALMDLGNVHSNCRLCIRTADLHRKEIGPVRVGQPAGEKKPKGASLELHVRERGKFWLRPIYLVEQTFEELKEKINDYVPHDSSAYLHSMHELWSKKAITADADIAEMPAKTEIEAIFVTPQHWEKLGLLD